MILIVDRDPVFLDQAHKILNRERQVFLALNAQQAIILAEKLGFSVVLVNLDLPGADGFNLIAQLHEAYPELAIIAISSLLKDDALETAKASGAVAVLQKPVSPEWKVVVERFRALRRRN